MQKTALILMVVALFAALIFIPPLALCYALPVFGVTITYLQALALLLCFGVATVLIGNLAKAVRGKS